MRIAILAAMKEELKPFRKYFPTRTFLSKGKCQIEKSRIQNHEIILVETGIGKANAAFATTLLCHTLKPDLIINTGSAGALLSKLSIGDVIFASEFVYSDVDATAFDYKLGQVPQMPEKYSVQKIYIDFFESLQRTKKDYQTHIGQIVTSDSFMSSHDHTMHVITKFPDALASDMEGTAIAQVASFYDVPTFNVRSISDIAGKNSAETFDNELDTATNNAFKEVIAICQNI